MNPRRSRFQTLKYSCWLLAVLILAALAALGWRHWRSADVVSTQAQSALRQRRLPEEVLDPRLTFATPYRNVRPDVQYVGDEKCAECHSVHAENYRQTPMGRSIVPVAAATPIERYDAAARDPFETLGIQFLVERQGDKVVHKELRRDEQGRVLSELRDEVQFAFGSGSQGREYLINRDGFVFRSPVSWFRQKAIWDLAPGFSAAQHFEQQTEMGCLYCHANHVEPVSDTMNRYREPVFHGYSIGCERCHGPGQLHVQRRSEEATQATDVLHGKDETIVNPRRLPPDLREGVCYQCHLHGEARIDRYGRTPFDYRPGLPLNAFITVFINAGEATSPERTNNQIQQMESSLCFRASQGKLGCTSCHDSHQAPTAANRIAFYRTRCLECHEQKGCSLPKETRLKQNPADSCIDCHMPHSSGSNIAHTAITNHGIPRRPDLLEASSALSAYRPSGSPLVPFHSKPGWQQDRSLDRDLGLGLTQFGRKYSAFERECCAMARPLLATAVQTRPDDKLAWLAQGYVLARLDRRKEALNAVRALLELSPQHELALNLAANLAIGLGQGQEALTYLERLVLVNPWTWRQHYDLARLLGERGNWERVVTEAEAARRLNPSSTNIRKLLAEAYARTGHAELSRKEAEMAREFEQLDAKARQGRN